MSFAVRYVNSMSDVYNRVQQNSKNPRVRMLAQRSKLMSGLGAMGNAVNPNPIVGVMDMAIMVTLTREIMAEPWAAEILGPQDHAMVLDALKVQETDIWSLASSYLSAERIRELHALAEQWRKQHPDQRYVGGTRLVDFPDAKSSDGAGENIAGSVFNLLRLDPFAGLDPAVRQVEESRVLAERMFFYLQGMPTLIAWQTEMVYTEMLEEPQVAQLFKDTSKISGNTTDFTLATKQFADACTRFANTIETFRTDLPNQQTTLVKQLNDVATTQRDAAIKQSNADVTALLDTTVKQLNDLVATQREAAFKQAATEIATQRDAAIKQLNSTATTQQSLMTSNLQTVMDHSIGQLYRRVIYLIFIAAAAWITVLVIYRQLGRARPPGTHTA